MKKEPRFLREDAKSTRKIDRRKLIVISICVVIGLIQLLIVMLAPFRSGEDIASTTEQSIATTAEVQTQDTAESTSAATEETTVPPVTEPTILPALVDLYAENPDLAGWISIEGTVVDYPVMYTPEDDEKYIYANFNGRWDLNGLPFIDGDCSINPESDNLIIYGHNMNSGAMFASLMNYVDESFWREHRTVRYSTLYEEREYEIVAAFYDRVYYKYEDCFKFYQFIDARDQAHFEEAMAYYKENALYDTGVTAEYGDSLITLVTCSYHEDNGRFVVVARQKNKYLY